MPDFARRLLLVLLGLLVGLVMTEIVLHVASPIRADSLLPLSYKTDELARLAVGDAYVRFDPVLGWAATESSVRRDDKITYRTNSAGMRSEREVGLKPTPGVGRLAAFGDSFTFCDEVDNPECWTVQLEQELKGTAEVLNFGVPAYGPDQAWLRYQRDGAPYQPCGVLIGYMVENINRVVNRFRPFYRPDTGIVLSKPRFMIEGDQLRLLPNPATSAETLADPRWVETVLGPHDAWYQPGMFVGGPFDLLRTVRVARTELYQRRPEGADDEGDWTKRLTWAYRPEEEAFQVAGRVLVEFARDVRQHGATPVVIVFGRKEEVVSLREGRPKVYAPLLEWLAKEGISTIDVTDALLRQARGRGVDSLIDKHYTRRGNQVVADLLGRELPARLAPTCGPTATG